MSISISNNFQKDLVSVILPTKNRSYFLKEAIQSVVLQVYRPIELIIIDDGSTDQTKQIIENCQFQFSEYSDLTMHYFYQDSKGAPSARNLGLIESKGEYIQYLDSDDLLHPSKLKIQVSILKLNEKCDYVWSNHELFEDITEVQPIEYHIETLMVNQPEAIVPQIMSIPSTCWSGLYRRRLCINTGFWNEDLVRWQDFEYNVRVSCLNPLCKYVDANLYFWRTHSSGRIADLNKSISGIQEAFNTLNYIKLFFNNNDIEIDDYINHQLWLRYTLLSKESLESGSTKQIHDALKTCLQHRYDFLYKIKILIYRLTLFSLGQSTSRKLAKTVSKIRNLLH